MYVYGCVLCRFGCLIWCDWCVRSWRHNLLDLFGCGFFVLCILYLMMVSKFWIAVDKTTECTTWGHWSWNYWYHRTWKGSAVEGIQNLNDFVLLHRLCDVYQYLFKFYFRSDLLFAWNGELLCRIVYNMIYVETHEWYWKESSMFSFYFLVWNWKFGFLPLGYVGVWIDPFGKFHIAISDASCWIHHDQQI